MCAAPFERFGTLLAEARIAAGFALQQDLASLLETTQQTVSRWEAGTSRPRINQIPKIAAVLRIDVDELTRVAGYLAKQTTVSFDQPLPVDALSPESFERFSQQFLFYRYPGAKVERYGGPGHKQDGLDLLVTESDGTRRSFQCKRETEFGPQKVHAAVAKHTVTADHKVILLTRIASPQARDAMHKHVGWEIWDREDISLRVRELSLDAQRRLVRTFFRGQELALLGEVADSPWETIEEFFAAFRGDDLLFHHEWQLVGRDVILNEIAATLDDASKRAVFLTGPGGSGKSRVLKHVIETFAAENPAVMVRLISRDGQITKKSMQDLGNEAMLLVVDDAHDRDDLQPLFEQLAIKSNLRAVLAFRPYGLNHIRAQASGFSIAGPIVQEFALETLTKAAAEELAIQVLKKLNGPIRSAARIAQLTLDCPLATVIGAQVVAMGGVHADLAQNEDVFRSTLMGRLEAVVAGRLGDPADTDPLRKLLRYIALVQPLDIDDDRILAIFTDLHGTPIHETKRLLRLLVQAGVLFKRGARYRLSPDVLGDFLIEDQCVGIGGASTGYAEQVFDALGGNSIDNLLLNLGRLDWRRTGARPDESPLLDGIWAKLKPEHEYGDPHIAAVRAVAYYQPKRCLAFVDRMMSEGRYLSQLPEIVKYAAYNAVHLQHGLDCLWELGRADRRALNSHTDHPIRIMKGLAEPEPNKPLEFVEKALDFALALADRPDAWDGAYVPTDILEAFLATEGHRTSSNGRSVSFSPYFLPPSVVAPLRDKVVDKILQLLPHTDPVRAAYAARLLATALRKPMGLFGATAPAQLHAKWNKHFQKVLAKLHGTVSTTKIDPIVQVELERSLAWLAGHGECELAKPAQEIIASLSKSLDFRVERLLMDGHGMDERRANRKDHDARWAKVLQETVQDVVHAYGEGEKLRVYIEHRLKRIEDVDKTGRSTPYIFISQLLAVAPPFAEAIIENASLDEGSATSRFSGMALADLLRRDPERARTIIASMFNAGRSDLRAAVGLAYAQQVYGDGWFTEFDHHAIGQILESDDEWAILCALRGFHRLLEWNESEALRLIRRVRFVSARVAEETAALFGFEVKLSLNSLSKEDALSLLERLEPLPELDGYWINKLLARISELCPWECADFFMRRVETAIADDAAEMRPANWGPWGPHDLSDRLAFRKTPHGMAIMRKVANWMAENADRRGLFGFYSRQLFETMFGPYDQEVVDFLQDWLKQAREPDILQIASILREAGEEFVFQNVEFVTSFLERARQFGPKILRMASSELYCSAIEGERSGVAGEPFERDILQKERVARILASLPRYSAARTLYEDIGLHAEEAIKRAYRFSEDLDG